MAAPSRHPVIDSAEFARKGLAIHGTIALSQFSRLSDRVASSADTFEYELKGDRSPDGKLMLHLQVRGNVELQCQRCLKPCRQDLDIETRFILVSNEDLIPSDSDAGEEEYLVTNVQTEVIELLEDELLLALPFAPKHADENCAADAEMKTNTGKQSPFAVLQGLKTQESKTQGPKTKDK